MVNRQLEILKINSDFDNYYGVSFLLLKKYNFFILEAGWSSWGQQQGSTQPPPVATPIPATSPSAASPSRAPSSTPSIAASEPPNGTLKKVT